MHDGNHNSQDLFPHDGEGGRPCTGFGCNCDEQNYGSRGGGSRGGGSGKIFWIGFIIACVVGGINELLGAIIMIGVIFYIMVS